MYTAWKDAIVVLQLRSVAIEAELHCTILGESRSMLRIRIAYPLDVEFDIYKDMVVKVCATADPHAGAVPQDLGEFTQMAPPQPPIDPQATAL